MRVYYSINACTAHRRDIHKVIAAAGGEIEFNPFKADFIIAYFCGLATTSFRDIPEPLEILRLIKEQNPRVKIVAGGCAGEVVKFHELYPWIDGTFRRNHLVSDLCNAMISLCNANNWVFTAREFPLTIGPDLMTALDLSKGCLRKCSFCKTHYLSLERSEMDFDDARLLVRNAVERGAKQLCILGENATEYGLIRYNKRRLVEFLKTILDDHPDLWLKLTGICLDETTEEEFEFYRDTPQIVMVQMEAQHLITSVRQKMNLVKTTAEILPMLEAMQPKIIGSTIITGHPGETPEIFNAQLDLVREHNLYALRFETLDPTPGTAAAAMPGQIPLGESLRRESLGNALIYELREKFVQQWIDSREPTEVFVTAIYEGNLYTRTTTGSFTVKIPCSDLGQPIEQFKVGDHLSVRVTKPRKLFSYHNTEIISLEGEFA